jgi:tetrahydromethanopterin S-methyltransferase subunit A
MHMPLLSDDRSVGCNGCLPFLANLAQVLVFHFHQLVVEMLGEIRIIGIADIHQPIN